MNAPPAECLYPGKRIPPHWGGQLTQADYDSLAASWITPELADQSMLRRVDSEEGRQVVGQKGKRDCSGIVFPYYGPGEAYPHSYRLRRDNPEFRVGTDGQLKADRKYLAAPGASNRLYLPPDLSPEQLREVSLPLVVTEGEKKCLALARLATHNTDRPRFIPVAISGVWNWRGTVGKGTTANGKRVDLGGPINDLDRIVWDGREVLIVFDRNIHANKDVRLARSKLSKELAKRNARVRVVDLPEDCVVNGIDDLLAQWGPDKVLDLLSRSRAESRLQVQFPPNFECTPDGTFRVVPKGQQVVRTQLSNFQAVIKTDIHLDDGQDTKRELEIEAQVSDAVSVFTVPALEFNRMEWPIERLGPRAIIYPNQKEYTRTAIQSLSLNTEYRRIYTHTGWRQIDARWMYLHAGGAISAAGAVPDICVKPIGTLSRYRISVPQNDADLKHSVRTSLELTGLGSADVGFALRAATCRSVFGGVDFSVHLSGETGAFKSERAALEQQFFGAGMHRKNLPAAWSSTGNALEVTAFHGKDALLVIDDFAPQGTATDVNRYHATAERVFRAAGNNAGRGRLDSSARLREQRPPRALVLSTGEEIPRGHSIRARLLILEMSKGDIESSSLARFQRDAEAGIFAMAMGGFLKWMAKDFDSVQERLAARAAEFRIRFVTGIAHARTPDIVASLQAGFEAYLDFAEAVGAIDSDEREEYESRCWEALVRAGAAQAKYHLAAEPTARFFELLRSCLVSGRAHLLCRDGAVPSNPAAFGWRIDGYGNASPRGDCIGWVDNDHLYLEPTVSFQTAYLAAKDVGESLPVCEKTLRKRLKEKNLLLSVDEKRETLTVRRTIAGASLQVLHLHRSALLHNGDGTEETIDWAGQMSGHLSGAVA